MCVWNWPVSINPWENFYKYFPRTVETEGWSDLFSDNLEYCDSRPRETRPGCLVGNLMALRFFLTPRSTRSAILTSYLWTITSANEMAPILCSHKDEHIMISRILRIIIILLVFLLYLSFQNDILYISHIHITPYNFYIVYFLVRLYLYISSFPC